MANIETKIFNTLPDEAKCVREEVFIKEQGFSYDLDETDSIATHIVVYADGVAVAACRIFESETPEIYILGRLAVKKEFRLCGFGSITVNAAIEHIRQIGGLSLILHSQLHARAFYEKLGFVGYGEIEYEEDCPHIWMKKDVRL